MHFFLASSTGNSQSLTGALGLNWWSLAVNALAFLIVAWVLGRYVFPTLTKALETKADEYAAASRLKKQADEVLGKAEEDTRKLVNEARRTAEQIVADARDQAAEIMKTAEHKAGAEAERLLEQGREQLTHDVAAARQELKAATAKLAAEAARAILRERMDAEADARIIRRSLEEVEV